MWVLINGTFDKILMYLWLRDLSHIVCIMNVVVLQDKDQTTGLPIHTHTPHWS